MGIEQYIADFSRNFPRGSTIAPKGYGVDISLPCSGGHDAPAHFDKRMPIGPTEGASRQQGMEVPREASDVSRLQQEGKTYDDQR